MDLLRNAVKFQRPSWWFRDGWRMPVPPRRVVLWSAVSAVPMAVVILVGAYLSHNLHVEIAVSRERVEQTHRVLATLNQLFIALQDAETGQRGFVITGEDSYLTPYAEAVTTLPPTLGRLRELTAESTTQSIRIGRLQTLVDAKLVELGRTIMLRRTSGFQVAATDIARGDGKDLMDDVRREVDLIGTAERTLLQEHQNVAQEREREVLRVGLAVALLSVGTRIGLALLLVRLRKRRAAANLKAALAAARNLRQDEGRKLQA